MLLTGRKPDHIAWPDFYTNLERDAVEVERANGRGCLTRSVKLARVVRGVDARRSRDNRGDRAVVLLLKSAFAILLVSHVFHPLNNFAIRRLLDCNVCHGRRW
jgi:hypothetical protein